MGFEETLAVFVSKNTRLAKESQTRKEARTKGISVENLDEKDVEFALQQHKLEERF